MAVALKSERGSAKEALGCTLATRGSRLSSRPPGRRREDELIDGRKGNAVIKDRRRAAEAAKGVDRNRKSDSPATPRNFDQST
ncbi:hypothetical protein L596_011892 [Steinernema carpocapsae]|uniref:Uncharacterized protein n=1 Tax=Steinernema carpocapsae TaxID=34508 RepID=A0A4U5NWA3_STECR|nr:hypothetical protein L596_011892 [Steinernema carpocapsae]